MKQLFLILAVLALPLQVSIAAEREAIVWLAEGVSLKGYKQLELHPVINDTGKNYEFDVAALMTQTIRSNLELAGLEVLEPNENPQRNVIGLQNRLVEFIPGSVGGRWVSFGLGAAVCILRTLVVDDASGEIVAEIISAKVVDEGGLFTAGAEKTVPKGVAKRAAGEVAELVGMQIPPEEQERNGEDW